MRRMEAVVLMVGVLIGMAIAYVDSQPTWDDAGITAGALLISALLLGALAPRRRWMVALAVGGWVPLAGILLGGTYASLIALVFPFVGAYAGGGVRRLVSAH